MSLDPQLQVLWSNPKLLAAGAVVLAVATQTLYKKRKRVQRAEPQWSRTSFHGWGLRWKSGEIQTRFSITHSTLGSYQEAADLFSG